MLEPRSTVFLHYRACLYPRVIASEGSGLLMERLPNHNNTALRKQWILDSWQASCETVRRIYTYAIFNLMSQMPHFIGIGYPSECTVIYSALLHPHR